LAQTATASKVSSLADAATLVRDGDLLALSGFSIARNAAAFVRELIRQGRRELSLVQCILGYDSDLLVGAGLVKRVIYGGGSFDRFGQLSRTNPAIEQGAIVAEYQSSLTVCFRLLAGALGLPFMPIQSMLGSDLLKELHEETAPDAFREMDCPFTGQRLLLARALVPDVAVITAQMADADGNARVYGPRWDNNEAARAAKQVVVLAEELVPPEVIRQQPELTMVPGFRVSAVVPLPFVAHPSSLYRRYDYDAEHIRLYASMARTQQGFDEYVQRYVLEPKDHFEYLERVGGLARLSQLKADPILGY
jgi:acyl CoA:acetate/3-ketoacid CoA transferase alpha subunit